MHGDCGWRRWEPKTPDFEPNRATTGNHGKPDPELAESKDGERHFRETALPTGQIDDETAQGRADVGDVPTAQTLGTLARQASANPATMTSTANRLMSPAPRSRYAKICSVMSFHPWVNHRAINRARGLCPYSPSGQRSGFDVGGALGSGRFVSPFSRSRQKI